MGIQPYYGAVIAIFMLALFATMFALDERRKRRTR